MTRVPTSTPSLTPQQLAALLEEMAAQARLGIPWADALEVSEKRLGAGTLEPLAEQLRRGRGVQEVLAEIAGKYGPQVAAVVQAGAASGRPAEALAGMAGLIRRRIEYRRRLAMALVYPVVVSLFAAGLLIAGIVWSASHGPVEMGTGMGTEIRGVEGGPTELESAWRTYWWVIPAAVLSVSLLAFLLHRKIANWLPPRLRAIRWARLAWFAELVALELEQGMPMGEAVRLSAEASGDLGMRRAAVAWSAAEQRGATLGDGPMREPGGAPSLLVWTLQNGAESPLGFPEALRRLAGIYWYRSERAANLWTRVLPAVLIVSVAGGLAMAFILMVLGPLYKTFP